MTHPDWNPAAYGQFRDLRLRPALDLMAQVGDVPEGDIIDLGCGSGAAAGALGVRFGARVIGVDQSATMLAEAEEVRMYRGLTQADIAQWQPATPPALIFSNAALHWLPDHAALMPRLAAMLAPGGTLAVQMPRQYFAPSHRFLRDIAAALFPDRFDTSFDAPVQPAVTYWEMLASLGEVQAWETDYIQHLAPTAAMHPVRAFTQSTAMRPFVERLTEGEQATFAHAYDMALASAYPLGTDGSALMPFRRIFFTLKV